MSNSPGIKIAISSCLLGEKVRYDGTDKKLDILTRIPGDIITFIPVCPEVAIGMGIPRPPIQLVETSEGIQALQIDDPDKSFTEPLQAYGAKIANELKDIFGYIFKARSPSCGINSTPVFRSGEEHHKDAGLHAKQIMQQHPGLPIIEETTLTTLEQVQDFFSQVFKYSQQKHATDPDLHEKQQNQLSRAS